MIPTEKQALAHLRKGWAGLPVFIQPIETSTGKGVPDTYMWFYGSLPGHGWWLELKRGNRTLRPEQSLWLSRAAGRRHPCGVLRVFQDYQFRLDTGSCIGSLFDGRLRDADSLYHRLCNPVSN